MAPPPPAVLPTDSRRPLCLGSAALDRAYLPHRGAAYRRFGAGGGCGTQEPGLPGVADGACCPDPPHARVRRPRLAHQLAAPRAAERAAAIDPLALRHEVRVLRRQVTRTRWRPGDRLRLAALSPRLPGSEGRLWEGKSPSLWQSRSCQAPGDAVEGVRHSWPTAAPNGSLARRRPGAAVEGLDRFGREGRRGAARHAPRPRVTSSGAGLAAAAAHATHRFAAGTPPDGTRFCPPTGRPPGRCGGRPARRRGPNPRRAACSLPSR